MKWNIIVGSMVLGASLCTSSFAGGLLDRMLGLKGCGCDSTCCDTGCGAGPSCGADPSCGCESACGNGNGCGNGCGAAPSCGCESACGSGNGCGNGCGAAPSCGCESACGSGCGNGCGAAPSCGCETAAPSCCKPRRKPLLELLGAVKCKKDALISKLRSANSCCDTGCGAAPSCGCESACGSGCGNGCGAAPSCGCEVATCDSGCGGARVGLLSRIFKHKRSACCDSACDSCGVAASSCNSCGGGSAPAAQAAPMPPAPVVDPSAYLQSNRRVIQATSYVR